VTSPHPDTGASLDPQEGTEAKVALAVAAVLRDDLVLIAGRGKETDRDAAVAALRVIGNDASKNYEKVAPSVGLEISDYAVRLKESNPKLRELWELGKLPDAKAHFEKEELQKNFAAAPAGQHHSFAMAMRLITQSDLRKLVKDKDHGALAEGALKELTGKAWRQEEKKIWAPNSESWLPAQIGDDQVRLPVRQRAQQLIQANPETATRHVQRLLNTSGELSSFYHDGRLSVSPPRSTTPSKTTGFDPSAARVASARLPERSKSTPTSSAAPRADRPRGPSTPPPAPGR
jgi:hypothetical protein